MHESSFDAQLVAEDIECSALLKGEQLAGQNAHHPSEGGEQDSKRKTV
jgi:hypothetical protein